MAQDWGLLRRQAGQALTPEQVKEMLPPAWVLERYGHTLEDRGGRLAALCPWHHDTTPSLDVFDWEGQVRVGCFPCGKNGDVLDLIGWLEDCDYATAMSRAEALLAEFNASAWEAPDVAARPRIEPDVVGDAVYEATQGDLTPLRDMIDAKGWQCDAEWLREHYEVGCIEDAVIIPHRGADGGLTGYKIRRGAEKLAAPGSRFEELYGHWLDQGRPDVVLVEGEPDTWSAAYTVGDRYDVLGLPTGAGSRVRVERLVGRRVILAFDGDDAGRAALARWVPALIEAGATVRVLPLADGHDLSMLPDIGAALGQARALVPYAGAVLEQDGILVARRAKGTEPVTNWTFTPTRELRGENGLAYEGRLSTGATAVITADDLATSSKAQAWAARHGLMFRGTDKDARDILGLLETQGPLLPPGRMTGVLGLHDGHFVLPSETVGPDHWVYVPPVELPLDTFRGHPLLTGYPPAGVVRAVRDLHEPRIMDPFLAWMAAAPLRSLLREFPILAVTGSSGTGKSTLIETVLRALSGGHLMASLGSGTTRFTVTSFAGATNAFPVWFDEYRAGIRLDTKDAVHNTILAAYLGQPTFKGTVRTTGMGLDRYDSTAPLIVSGEDAFSETAHVDRMILLALPREGRNPKALDAVRHRLDTAPYAACYLHWLSHMLRADRIGVTVLEAGPESLSPRQRMNLGVLNFGWELLQEFLGQSLGTPDWSWIIREAEMATRTDPIRDAVLWALEEVFDTPLAWRSEQTDEIYVRVPSLVSEVQRRGVFALPGGAKAVTQHLIGAFQGKEVRTRFVGRQYRVIAVPAAAFVVD